MKIAVVGAGNAGSFTALHYAYFSNWVDKPLEVELFYNPKTPPERVGQATTLDAPHILWATTGFNWYNNKINATFKTGILYEGWGKKNDEIFHPFPADRLAMHYCPWEMQKSILDSGRFKVTEGEIDPKNVDADYVFDCRGTPTDFSNYDILEHPINAVILGKPNWDTSKIFWSRHVATPDGWTFVIPTAKTSPSNKYCVGYCYNSSITSRAEAESNFKKMFDVEITKQINFKNYVAKNPIVDKRIFLNGNRLFFLEPLESSSTQTYLNWSHDVFRYLIEDTDFTLDDITKRSRKYINQVHNFVLWHYQYGSKYDTPFWDFAKTIPTTDPELQSYIETVRGQNDIEVLKPAQPYGQWGPFSFKSWDEGVTK